MIDRQQLAAALGRLDPRDREVLDYSLRRHVPDEDLAAVFDCGPGEVARMRAAAIERLADDLGVQRGADLGHVLTALLDQGTWDQAPPVAPPPGRAEAAPAAGSGAGPRETYAPAPAAGTGEREPVLDMLDDGDAAVAAAGVGGRSWTTIAAALAALLIAVGFGSVLVLGDAGSSAPADEDAGTRPFVPREGAIGEPFPSDPSSAYRYPIAIVDGPTTLLDAPGGRSVARLAAETEWDSPRVLSIVERRGGWLGVLAPELDNGEIGWVREEDVARLDTVGWAVHANLAARTVAVERDGEVVRRFRVGVGRDDHPTPTGRFAVTDKLEVTDPGSPYGCCVVALSGHQTRLPAGWPGGDRLAIHATADLSGLGEAVSLGCLRAAPENARWLMNRLPLGTPVFVEAGGGSGPATSRRAPARR